MNRRFFDYRLKVKLIDKSSIYGTARGACQFQALWLFAEGLFCFLFGFFSEKEGFLIIYSVYI